MSQPDPARVAARAPELVLSDALLAAGIEHKVKVVPCEDGPLYSIEGVHGFKSVAAFAVACDESGFDAVYSAGSGWSFVVSRVEYERRAAEANARVEASRG